MISSSPSAVRAGHVELRNLTVAYRGAAALRDFGIAAEPGQFICFLGPSGCGKSTALNAIAGFLPPTSGEVLVDGAPIRGPGADRGVVFQHYSLFPWKTALANIAFGLRMRGIGSAEARRAAHEWIDRVGLSGFADRYPHTLSGGMQQRVAIARALINRPSVLLMDEPFGALDAQARALMQELLLDLWRDVGATIFFVTHDVDEAIYLADRVIVFSAAPGRVILDLPIDLPRPRPPDISASGPFNAAKLQCLELIRREGRRIFDLSESAA